MNKRKIIIWAVLMICIIAMSGNPFKVFWDDEFTEGERQFNVKLEVNQHDAIDIALYHLDLARCIAGYEELNDEMLAAIIENMETYNRVVKRGNLHIDADQLAADIQQCKAGLSKSERKEAYYAIHAGTDCMMDLNMAFVNNSSLEKVEAEVWTSMVADGRIDYISDYRFIVTRVMIDGQWTEDFEWPPEN